MPSTSSDVKRQSNPRTSLDNAKICQGSEKMSFHPETPEDNLQKRGYSFIYILFIMSVRDFLKYVTYANVPDHQSNCKVSSPLQATDGGKPA